VNVCHLIELVHQSPLIKGLVLWESRDGVVWSKNSVGSGVNALFPVSENRTAQDLVYIFKYNRPFV
jgi:hypothetical protein